MRISEFIRNSVVFVGGYRQDGTFVPLGTGFFIGDPIPNTDRSFTYLVTAKHIVEDLKAASDKEMIPVLRANRHNGDAALGRLSLDGWHYHPTIPNTDIAITPVNLSDQTFDFYALNVADSILTEEYIEKNDIGCGDEVHVCGLLTRHFGRTRNIPIVRTGNIAAMPEEPVDLGDHGLHSLYLIESRSIGGLSGSPVFLTTPPFRVVDGHSQHNAGHKWQYLMGVNIGLFETMAHADRIQGEPLDSRMAFLETMSSGIAVVVPIQRVLEILGTEYFTSRKQQKADELTNSSSSIVPED